MIPILSSTHNQPPHGFGRGQLRQTVSRLFGAFLVCLAGMMVSCGGGSNANGGSLPSPLPSPLPSSEKVVVYGTVKNFQSNRAIVGAQVTDGSATATTDATGSFSLSVLPGERKQFTVTAAGFGETQIIANLLTNRNNYVNACLLPSTIISVSDLDSETTLEVPGTSAQVVLPENALVTNSGALPTFPVTASLTPIDPSSRPELMPGDYTTNVGTTIESFGAMDVTFTDNSGSKLNLAAGKTATIRIPAASLYCMGNGPTLVPAWYYDTLLGRWVEEGTMTLGGVAPNNYYEGTVSHFTTWNADDTTATAYITGKVVRKDGTIVPNASVKVTGSDYVGFSSVTSGPDGTFSIPVKASGISIVTASAYTTYGTQLFSPAPGVVVTAGAAGTYTALPTTTPAVPVANSIVVDMYLNLSGTLRDFSPSAPYNFPVQIADNGTFDSDTIWTKDTAWTISGGVANCAAHTGTSNLTQALKLLAGQSYTVAYTIKRTSTKGTITPILGGKPGTAVSATGSVKIVCGTTDSNIVFQANASFVGTIDDVTVTIGDGHPPAVTCDPNTPFPIYKTSLTGNVVARTGQDPYLAQFDGPWWNPDFESSNDYLGQMNNLVLNDLGSDNKPVFNTTKVWSASVKSGIHSEASFNAWWNDFPSPHGPNDKDPYQTEYTIPLSEKLPSTDPPTYVYDNKAQFPIDQRLQGNYIHNNPGSTSSARGTAATCPDDTPANSIKHNFHYSYELHTMFAYKPGQFFEFIGDDDVWVFINKKLVIDLGGAHSELGKSITLDANAKDSSGALLNLVEGEYYQFDFFYLERHTTQSHMKITTSMSFVQAPN